MEKCKKCGSTNIILIQYRGTTEDYDGISEIKCFDCGVRIGRWTGKELKEGELEPMYGIK
jgi:DNA-directed RNA polymerase subunit RPC12/RpoP